MDPTMDMVNASFEVTTKKCSVESSHPVAPSSMRRKARWKRRRSTIYRRRIFAMTMLPLLACLFISNIQVNNASTMRSDLGNKAEKVIFEIFPEAKFKDIEIKKKDRLIEEVRIYLPAYMLEPSHGINDPIVRLSKEFGWVEKRLLEVDIKERIEKIIDILRPNDIVKCYNYFVGTKLSPPAVRRPTRSLNLKLNSCG